MALMGLFDALSSETLSTALPICANLFAYCHYQLLSKYLLALRSGCLVLPIHVSTFSLEMLGEKKNSIIEVVFRFDTNPRIQTKC